MGYRLLVGLVPFMFIASSALAQDEVTGNGLALKVFLDCNFHCDFDHFRREVTWVNYMRDRRDAEVHVLVTRQSTGGGDEFTFNFIGLGEYVGRNDTLRFNSSNTDTGDERRDGLVATFRFGLIPFIVGTPIAQRISILYEAPERPIGVGDDAQEDDPWDFWVFSVRVGGFLNGEEQSNFTSLNGGINANRTTEELKLNLNVNGRYTRSETNLQDGTSFVSTTENYSGTILTVWSLGDHWSIGGRPRISRTSRLNQDLAITIAPALEFNVFPYAESTRRQMTFQLRVGASHFNYEEVTILEKLSETRPTASLQGAYEVVQPWGSIEGSIEGFIFVDDPKYHRVDVFGETDIRIVRGLNFNTFGGFSRIKDQIYLPLEEFSDEERLTGQFQLGTDYSFFFGFGLRYEFGSIFNNVVNPRMGG